MHLANITSMTAKHEGNVMLHLKNFHDGQKKTTKVILKSVLFIPVGTLNIL